MNAAFIPLPPVNVDEVEALHKLTGSEDLLGLESESDEHERDDGDEREGGDVEEEEGGERPEPGGARRVEEVEEDVDGLDGAAEGVDGQQRAGVGLHQRVEDPQRAAEERHHVRHRAEPARRLLAVHLQERRAARSISIVRQQQN